MKKNKKVHKRVKHHVKHAAKSKAKHKSVHSSKHHSAHKALHKSDAVKKHVVHHRKPVKHYGQKFCPNCGRKIEHGVEFCTHCKHVDFNFKDIDITVCNNCHSYIHRNKWAKFTDINHVIEKIVSENVKEKISVSTLKRDEAEKLSSFKAGVNKEFIIEVSMNRQKFDLPAMLHVTLCPKCSKKGTQYFESILQVRNSNREINDVIRSDINRQASKGIHLNKEVNVDGTENNVDFYLTNRSYARVIAEKLRKIYGGTMKKNAQLFSIDWETSKNLYRLNILLELPNYRKNDVIKKDDALFKVVSIDRTIHVMDLKNNHRTALPHSNGYDILKPVEVMIVKRYPEFEILDPTTYYQARLMNPTERLQINQKIRVVIDGGEAWMVKE